MPETEAIFIVYSGSFLIKANLIIEVCRHPLSGNSEEDEDGSIDQTHIRGGESVDVPTQAVPTDGCNLINHHTTGRGFPV